MKKWTTQQIRALSKNLRDPMVKFGDVYLAAEMLEAFADLLDQQASAETQPAVSDGWRSMDSAPRDGTPVDLWHKGGFRITESWWDSDDECWTCLMDDVDFLAWMPLPPPPTKEPQA